MSQPLKDGRVKQSTQKEQVDKSSIRLPPGRSTRAVTSEDPEFRNTGFGSSNFARGLRIQSTEPAPRKLEINGVLYQRVDHKPLNQSPEPMLEAPSETLQSVATKRKHGSETLRKTKSHECPEPQSEDTSQSPQPMTKRRKCKSKMLRRIQPHDKYPERRAEAASASTQRINGTTRKQKNNLKMLREIQPHNKSPEPRSEISSGTPQPIARDSSQPELPKRKRTSNMIRELEAYNESPEGDSEPDIEILDDLKAHLTRSARHNLINISKNRPLSPRRNLNLRTLMLAEFSGMPKGTKTFYPEDNSNVGLGSNRRQPESGKRVEIKIEEEEEDDEDSKINELLKAPRYSPPPSQQEIGAQGPRRPACHVRAETPEDFQGAFHMEQGLRIFTPTATAFSGFVRFLRGVKEVADRKVGVAKVVIPSQCLSCIPTPTRGTFPGSSVMKTTTVKLSLNVEAPEEPSEIYNKFRADNPTSWEPNDLLHIIQREKKHIIKTREISTEAISNAEIWKENHVLKPYTEGNPSREVTLPSG